MGKTVLRFDTVNTEKLTIHCFKNQFAIDNAKIEKIVASNKFSCSNGAFKYFIGLRYGKINVPLYIKFLTNG